MKKRRGIQTICCLLIALLAAAQMPAVSFAASQAEPETAPAAEQQKQKEAQTKDNNQADVKEGVYTIEYIVDPAYDHYYVLKQSNRGSYTVKKKTTEKITSFGAWLRAKNETGNGDMNVKMTLLNTVHGKWNQKDVTFMPGDAIDVHKNDQAFVNYSNGFGFTNFAADSVIQIMVSPYNPPAEANSYSIEFRVSPGGGGTLTGKTFFEGVAHGTHFGDAVTKLPQANPDPGYRFAGWDSVKGLPAADSKVEGNLHIEAEFEEDEAAIRYRSSDETAGTVDRTDEAVTAVSGSAEGVAASANSGFRFISWTDESGKEVSKEAEFIPQKNDKGYYETQTYTANFEEEVDQYDKGEEGTASTQEQRPSSGEKQTNANLKKEMTGNAAGTGAQDGTYGNSATSAANRNSTVTGNSANTTVRTADSQGKAAPAGVTIQDSQVPLAAGMETKETKDSGWALLNLILAVLAALLGVYVLAVKRQSRAIFKAGGALAAVCAILIFILTADMNLPMTFVDRWTAPIGLLTVLEAVVTAMAMKSAASKNKESC